MTEKHALFIQIYTELLPAIREAGKYHGYAIAVHGSLRRDFDLIAVPWTEEYSEPEVLLHSILDTMKLNKSWIDDCFKSKEIKPNGRVAYHIQLGAGMYIDLSIFEKVI